MLLYLDYLKGILPCRNPEETAAYYEEILLFPKEGARAFALGRSGHMEVVESSPVYAVGPHRVLGRSKTMSTMSMKHFTRKAGCICWSTCKIHTMAPVNSKSQTRLAISPVSSTTAMT